MLPLLPAGPHGPRVDWMSTAFMAFRRDALEQAGGMDETFFIYSDEDRPAVPAPPGRLEDCLSPTLETVHFGGKSLTPGAAAPLLPGYADLFPKHLGPGAPWPCACCWP